MRILGPIAAAAMLLAGCGSRDEGTPPVSGNQSAAIANAAAPGSAAGRWDLQSSGEGVALALLSGAGAATVRLFCPSGKRELLVNVPGFRPVGSEERLSFGSGGEVVALVADASGDRQRGGVSGRGPVPGNFAALVGGPIAVNYGAQNSGPHPAPPDDLARAFVGACQEDSAGDDPAKASANGVSACLMQGERRLGVRPMRALGTEPFWAARIEGRCVTYSHPEDQQGTRVWTRYIAGPGGGGTWSGALQGRLFELSIRPQPDCSDGMSDRRYPFAAELVVQGERRRGCAEPL